MLRVAAATATAASISLYAQLVSQLQAQITLLSSGKQIIGTSGNGRSTSFAMPDRFNGTTSDELTETYALFLNVYTAAVTTLAISTPAIDDLSHDAAILSTMLASDDMQAITRFSDDFTLLNYPQGR